MLTAEQVAQRLGITVPSLRGLMRKGRIAFYRLDGVVRFAPEDVQAYKDNNRHLYPTTRIPSVSELRKLAMLEAKARKICPDFQTRMTPEMLDIANSRYRREVRAPWADKQAINAIYAEAKRLTQETGVPHHVDHIIPLQGKHVSGLHVESNLRIIPAADNLRKRNKFEQ